jgi:hypothetical protein
MGHSHAQRGVTLMGLIILLFIMIFVALLAFKLIPAYIEYFTAKKAITALARDRGATVAEIRRNFDSRAAIDNIDRIKASDLEISKEGNDVIIGFAYRKEIPLFANIGMYIDFVASSRD